jgi:AcrR family transcriptional regulator
MDYNKGYLRINMSRKLEKTHERIFEAAIACFENHGYKKTAIDEIARSAGVGKGTVYLHFKDKDDLFVEVLKHKTDGLLKAATVGIDEEKDTISSLVCMAHNIIGYLNENPLLFNSLRNSRELGITHLQPQLGQLIESAITIKEKVILGGIENGDIKPINARLMAFVLNMAFESFYLTHKSDSLNVSSDEYIEFFERLLREGIASSTY